MKFTNQDVLAEALAHACAGEYRVLEFRTTDGKTTVADITDHLLALETRVNSEFNERVGVEPDREYD